MIFALTVVIVFSLCGCTVFNTSFEGLLSAPKLTAAQTEIINALLLGPGGEAELVYPRSGNYRSAIILKNLDEEETEEAIVFYREKASAGQLANNTQGEIGIRVGFLDKQEGKWRAVADCPLDGTEVEGVDFYNLDEKVTIGISCSVLSQTEKHLQLMQYGEDGVANIFSVSYSYMEMLDLDRDGFDELFYVSYDSLVSYYSAKIWGKIVDLESGSRLGEISSAPLNTDIAAVQKIKLQPWAQNQMFLYLDYLKVDGTYGSQLLYAYKNLLSTPTFEFELKQDESLSRRVNQYTPMLYCDDIDGDGYVEIPCTEPIMGYETAEAADQFYFTRWLAIDSNYQYEKGTEMLVPIMRKYLTYVDISGEFIFYIPVRWQGLITLEKEGNITTFYKYDKSEKLLSLCVSKEGIPTGDKWRRFGSVGSIVYINRPENNINSENSMALTEDELNSCLQIISHETASANETQTK